MFGGPIIKHLDEVPEQEVSRFLYQDGRTASIWEKWIQMSPRYVAFWNRWDPGALSPPHGHRGDHSNFILKGEIRSKTHVCRAGTHIMLEFGDTFGPWVAGPEGAELYGFISGEGAAFMGDPALWEAWLAEHGAVSVPIPMPKHLPPWSRKSGGVVKWADE